MTQFIIQNSSTDRQVKHEPKKETKFRQMVETPLSVGCPLILHSRVRDKVILGNMSEMYIGKDYQSLLNLEKRIHYTVLKRMETTGGFCLPDFVKKGLTLYFAIDNVNVLEDTPTGQNTLNGAVIVLFQRKNAGGEEDFMQLPLEIPDKLPAEASLEFDVKYMDEPVIKLVPIRFTNYSLSPTPNLRVSFTRTWALANNLINVDISKSQRSIEVDQVEEPEPQEDEQCGLASG